MHNWHIENKRKKSRRLIKQQTIFTRLSFFFFKIWCTILKKKKDILFLFDKCLTYQHHSNAFFSLYLSNKFDFFYIKINFQWTNNINMSHLFIRVPRPSSLLLSISSIMYISCRDIKGKEGQMEIFLYMFILMYMWLVYFRDVDYDEIQQEKKANDITYSFYLLMMTAPNVIVCVNENIQREDILW
jgi:hypothetical protein